MASETESRRKRALYALIAAWVLLLGLIAAGAGYVILGGEAPQTAESGPAPEPAADAAPEQPAETAAEPAAPGTAAESAGEEPGPEGTAAAAESAGETPTAPGEPETVGETIALQPNNAAAQAEAAAEAAPAPEATETTAEADHADSPPGEAASHGGGTALQEASLPPGGEPSWQRFAIPFEADKAGPRIAVVLTGLGLSAAATEAAIKQLPPAITLSFSPYARLLNQWIALARVNGHEVMLDLPMEPVTFPEDDPGPHALLTVLDREQNLKRLDWLLKRGNSYVGVAALMGSRFLTSEEHMLPVLEELKSRGLLFLDNRASEESVADALSEKLGLPYVLNDRTLDAAQASRVAIDARLSEVERMARENGVAVALAQPYPVTIERLRDWTAEVEASGLVLAPISALAAGK